MNELKTTPLHALHRKLGGRLVEFAGFEMPVQYSSILKEHAAVRERVGLFDVSHMGQIYLEGPDAIAAAERLVSCRVANLAVGRVRYGLLCNDAGGVVDDVTVYRLSDSALFFCVNAANIDKDHAWICEQVSGDLRIDNRSDREGMLALQGPNAEALLEEVAGEAPRSLERFSFSEMPIEGIRSLVSRTGYTGSPGFEIYLAAEDTPPVFELLLDRGERFGLLPAGLGARDTLRLEAALPLYGHELDDTTSPLEAGLGRFVKRDEAGFIGAAAIEQRAAKGHPRRLVGFEVKGRGVARAGYPILRESEEIGIVTSGGPSPTLGKSIGLGYVPVDRAELGSSLEIRVRTRTISAHVVPTPFVGRRKKR